MSLRGPCGKPVPKVVGGRAFGKVWLYLAGTFSERSRSGSEDGVDFQMHGECPVLFAELLTATCSEWPADISECGEARFASGPKLVPQSQRGLPFRVQNQDKASIPSVTGLQRETARGVGIQRKEQITVT